MMEQGNSESKTENMESIKNIENREESAEGQQEERKESPEDKKEEHGGSPEDKKEENGGSPEGKKEEHGGSPENKKEERKESPEDDKGSVRGEAEGGKKGTGKKAVRIFAGILLAALVICSCVYVAIAFSYKNKFLPGTWINGINCGELDGAQVAGLMENQLQEYCLEVTGRDYASGVSETLLGRITADDIQLTYIGNSREVADSLLDKQNIFTWAYRKLSDNMYSFNLSTGVSYDEERMRDIVSGWEACQPDNMAAPQDAYISDYSGKRKGYEVVPETEGTKFHMGELLELINLAILSQETSLDLEEEGCYEEPLVRQEDPALTGAVEAANRWLGTRVTYDWNGAEVIVDAKLLKDWITMEKDGPVLDEKAVEAFVKEQTEEYDTYGKRRSFVTTLGVELSLPSGYYGWLTDKEAETKELIGLIHQGKTVSREPVYASSARQKGMSDIGNSYVEVDLTHQHLYLYEGGAVVFETDFVSGSMTSTPDCVTPEGVFGISYKTTNAVLRGATYETPVNYWMPFYGNFGMHDATWRSEFGGQIYIENGSHGCVNLPLDAAATIYGHMSTGFPVICYYYQVDPLAGQYVEEEWDDDDGE